MSDAPEFDLEITHEERVRLSDFRGRSNVLLVFHPFAFTPVCEDEARDLQENLESFRNAQTEIVFVSCDSVRRSAGVEESSSASNTRSPRTSGRTGRRAKAYGVFNEETGAPYRGTFLIDKDGSVIWSLVKVKDEQRTEMVPESLDALHETV